MATKQIEADEIETLEAIVASAKARIIAIKKGAKCPEAKKKSATKESAKSKK